MTTAAFPVEAYLSRIALSSLPDRTVAGLRELTRAQFVAIPFENLDVLAGIPVRLDAESVLDKLVHRGRGGYCYELNALAEMALICAGFEVDAMMARVTYRREQPGPLAHKVLRVSCGGETWLVDVGFGGPGLIEPMRMYAGAIAEHEGARFRLFPEQNGELHLQREQAGAWSGLYRIFPAPMTPSDFEMANHFVSTHPHSPFRSRFMCVKPLETGMWWIDGRDLVRLDTQLGELDRRSFESQQEFADTMRSVFKTEVPEEIAARAWATARNGFH